MSKKPTTTTTPIRFPANLLASFPANFLALRTAAGESQQTAAVALGVAVATVSRWELGRNEPDLPMLRKIAKHYHTTVSELVKGE
jgi:transcriptional regulator with XRE-family HTH domain